MNHNTQYRIRLSNNSNRRCSAVVEVDGKPVGTFRLNAFGSLTLERPSGDNGRFTFYREGTKEAKQAQSYRISRSNKGLVSVTFKPEKYVEYIPEVEEDRPRYPYRYKIQTDGLVGLGEIRSFNTAYKASSYAKSSSAGITGLSGSSEQRFRKVAPLEYDDPSTWVIINLRLVAEVENNIRPLRVIGRRVENSTKVPRPL